MNFRNGNTRLLVSDFKACFLFYRDVLEFDVTAEDEKGGYAEFKVGDMRFSLFSRQEMAEIIGNDHKPSRAESQDNVALIFTVPDLDEAYQQLKHKGVKFTTEPLNNPYYGIRTAYLRDPNETLIGLYQLVV